jgi:superfamily II helicase
MSALSTSGIVDMDGMDVSPTEVGKIMAKYYIGLSTMELFLKVS